MEPEVDIRLDFLSDNEQKMLKDLLSSFLNNVITEKVNITVDYSREGIPGSIFSAKLGISEAIVKYLRENKGMGFSEISKLLHKTRNNVYVTYQNASRKVHAKFTNQDFTVNIPVDIFVKNKTCLESVCLYLRKQGMRYHDIAAILKRDDRTIWTVINRGGK